MDMLPIIVSMFHPFSHRHFMSIFGISVQTILVLWLCLNRMELPFHLKPIHLLWTLNFLKQYSTMDQASPIWKCDIKTFRLYVWRVVVSLFVYLDTVSLSVMITITIIINSNHSSFNILFLRYQ